MTRRNERGAPLRTRPGRAKLEFHPLTADRWPDLVALFGPRGAYGGCWCMWWRQTRAEYAAGRGTRNRRAFNALVKTGPPGVLAYADGRPVGWCAVGPRSVYPRLARSRVLKAVDDQPVWCVTCFFVHKAWRRRGLTRRLLTAAVEFAKARGAKIVEGYPLDVRSSTYPEPYAYTGFVSAFRAAGFREVARRSATRPILRKAARENSFLS